jgi:hypothetical protein
MNAVYAKRPEFVQREVAGECLLVPISRGPGAANCIFVLNETGAALWRRLDGKLALGEIVEQMLGEYEVGREQLERDIRGLVDDLLSIKAIS